MIVPFLKSGDKVAITAPASQVKKEDVLKGVQILENWGLQVVVGDTVGNSFFNFSDTLENRKRELQDFLDDDSIQCIFSARGGYGVSDLIDTLDFQKFIQNPKWIIGFSDLTALLLHINLLGYPAIHGPMAKTLIFDEFSTENLRRILFGENTHYHWNPNPSNKIGVSQGETVGGNLVLLAHSIGSKSDISYDGKILFIEDIGEKMYSIDRLMVQLKRAAKLKNLAGLVVGDFSDISENSVPFGSTVSEIILNHTSDYDYPMAFGFQFGHEDVNLPIVMGVTYQLDVKPAGVTLKSSFNGII
jgi:muramoyltetrapeptide carboxypeptidase